MEPLGTGDPRQVGPYHLVGVLGAGGMGRVYLGRSRSGRAVAVKVVHAELALDPDFRGRFAREIAAARAVSGIFTAAVVDSDPHAERPWLATAYVAGPSLSQAIAEHGPLPEASLRALGAGLAEALEAIHSAGVIHRDLKPSNVLLAADGPRVIDFGIARALEGTVITRSHVVLGSLGFMAPEQLKGDPVGPACDVFCLSLILCFALGVTPFGEGAAATMMYRVVHEEPNLSAVPEGLRSLVAACLAKDPTARPTPSMMLDQLSRLDVPESWLPETVQTMLPEATAGRERDRLGGSNSGSDNRIGSGNRDRLWGPPSEDSSSSAPATSDAQAEGQRLAAQGVAPASLGTVKPAEDATAHVALPPPNGWRPNAWQPANATAGLLKSTNTTKARLTKRGRRIATLTAVPAAVLAVALVLLTLLHNAGNSRGLTLAPPTGTTPTSRSASGSPPAIGPNTVNSGTATSGGTVRYALSSKALTFNPLDSLADPSQLAYTNGLVESPFIPQPDYSVKLNTDLLTSAQKTGDAPETVVYKINPKAKWNDGTAVSADDFKYAWLTQSGGDPSISNLSSSGYQNIASVTGSDGGATVTVVFKTGTGNYFLEWQSLFTLLPAHIAAKHGYDPSLTQANGANKGLEDSWTWFGANLPTWSDGPYQIDASTSKTDGTQVTLVRNPDWDGASPHLDKIVFTVVAGDPQSVSALQTGDVDVAAPLPTADLVTSLKNLNPTDSYQLTPGLVWEHLDFNLHNAFLGGATQADQEDPTKLALRQAMLTAIDRTAMINLTVGQYDKSVKPLNNRMVVPGQPGYQDDVGSVGFGSGDQAKARSILTTAGYTGVGTALTTPEGKKLPPFVLRYSSGNTLRQSECNIIQQSLAHLGVTVTVQSTDSLVDSLQHKDATHEYDMIVFAWAVTPFPVSGNNGLWQSNPAGTTTITSGNYGWYTNSVVDAKMAAAAAATDPSAAIADLDAADVQISHDAYTLPLFQRDSLIAFNAKLVNLRDNTTGSGPAYNLQDWGFKAS